jgi:hypothetical protein
MIGLALACGQVTKKSFRKRAWTYLSLPDDYYTKQPAPLWLASSLYLFDNRQHRWAPVGLLIEKIRY